MQAFDHRRLAIALATLAFLASASNESRAQPPGRALPRVAPTSHAAAPTDDGAATELPPGQAALDRARAAWEKGDYDVSEPLYSEAIERGGLSPADVLDAYVYLASARAILGKKMAALTAFKSAALLDLRFTVPADAGRKAVAIADLARRMESKTGALTFHAKIPDHVAPREAATVDATLDPRHAALSGYRIGIYATDPESGGSHAASVRTAPAAHFELPSELSLPSATLRVRVDWLDGHANRLATAEGQIHVEPLPTDEVATPLLVGPIAARARDASKTSSRPASKEATEGGGFWHSAWPYILGGAALAAGGAAVYFATRSSDDVNVTGVHIVTH